MTQMDREKVKTGIFEMLQRDTWKDIDKERHRFQPVLNEAISLLEERENEAEWIYGEDETGADGWHCSYCGFFEPWFYEFTDDIDFIRFYSFCPSCGRIMTSYTGKPIQTGG